MGWRRIILFFMMSLWLISCESTDCEECVAEEFVDEWWRVETDNPVAQKIIGPDCYSFMTLYTYTDTGYADLYELYGYDHNSTPAHWHVGSWEYGENNATFIIEDEYLLRLTGKSKECYNVETDAHGVAVAGIACPCEEKYD